MRGASAIESVLEQVHDSGLRAFIVWEPVLLTDWAVPSGATLTRVHDTRAVQFWDRKRRLSNALRGQPQFGEGDVIWDFVAVYPPGSDHPSYTGGPVVQVIEDVHRELARVAGLITLPTR